jgi:DNA topoisomerase-1
MSPADVDLDTALSLLSLPRNIGDHPETKTPIEAGIGRYGPYLKYDGRFISLKGDDDVLTIGMNRAVEVIATAPQGKGRVAAKALKSLGKHPEAGDEIELFSGRYGPYVKMGKVMASLPKGADQDALTLEEAAALIDKKAESKGTSKKKAPAKKKAADKKKTASKKTAAKKSTAKKKAAS